MRDWAKFSRDFVDFSWKQVNCFIRPQLVLLENYRAGCGSKALYLYSLLKRCGLTDAFDSDKEDFIAFLKEQVKPFAGVNFTLVDVSGEQTLASLLTGDGTFALVLGDIYFDPLAKEYGRNKQSHMFIVTSYDQQHSSYSVVDNMDAQGLVLTPSYASRSVAAGDFHNMMLGYQSDIAPIGMEVDHFGGTKVILCTQSDPAQPACRVDNATFRDFILESHRKHCWASNDRRDDIDCRYFRRIENARDSDHVARLSRFYLGGVNLASVYAEILLRFISLNDDRGSKEARLLVEQAQAKVNNVRLQILAGAVSGRLNETKLESFLDLARETSLRVDEYLLQRLCRRQ